MLNISHNTDLWLSKEEEVGDDQAITKKRRPQRLKDEEKLNNLSQKIKTKINSKWQNYGEIILLKKILAISVKKQELCVKKIMDMNKQTNKKDKNLGENIKIREK